MWYLYLWTFLYGRELAYKIKDLVNLIAFQLLRLSILLFPFTIIYCFCFLFRFCVCMLHEQFVRYLNALHKLYLAHHDSNCACDCLFCDSCEDIDRFNVSWFMRRMLCAPLLRFPGSTTRLYSWDCIENRHVLIFFALHFSFIPTQLHTTHLFSTIVWLSFFWSSKSHWWNRIWGLFWSWSHSSVVKCLCHWYNHERYTDFCVPLVP